MRRFSQDIYVDVVELPVANAADATVPASYIDVSPYERFAFLRLVGATDDTAVTMQVVQATAAAGTGSKNITGAAITGTVLAGANDNKFAIVEVENTMLDTANGFRYVAVALTSTGGTATIATTFFFAWRAREMPVTQPAKFTEKVYLDG